MHRNNFDFMRLMFAIFVIITHSYPLSGVPENDPLGMISGHQLSFSGVGVKGFFIISGYLIFQSAMRCRDWKDFMLHRVLRIYPAYFVVLVVGAIVGLIVTPGSAHDYIISSAPYKYIFTDLAMFLPRIDRINEVFATNPYKYAVNGSLWTIPYEFLFYILLSCCFLIKRYPKLLRVLIVFFYLALLAFTIRYEDARDLRIFSLDFEWHILAHFGLFFGAGALLAALNIRDFRYRRQLSVLSLLAFLAILIMHKFYFAQFVILPLVVILFGLMSTPGISGLANKIGDWSYGIYLYGFLVQQTLVHYFGFDTLRLALTAIPISILLGALSWHVLEKKALRLKKYFP